jgi:hypothetical protein
MPLPASRSLQGKTCYLYYLLVQRLIDARPTVFQDTKGDVFVIEDTVQYLDRMVIRPGHDILTLVDAEGAFCIPSYYILNSGNLRIVLTSPPRTHRDRKWLKQHCPYTGTTLVMEPWTKAELLLFAYVHPTRTTLSAHP